MPDMSAEKKWTPPADVQRRIVCAANMYQGYIVLGIRHGDVAMRNQIETLHKAGVFVGVPYHDWEQGFVDQFGEFHNREDALKIARAANQIHRSCGGDDSWLSSEGLY